MDYKNGGFESFNFMKSCQIYNSVITKSAYIPYDTVYKFPFSAPPFNWQ